MRYRVYTFTVVGIPVDVVAETPLKAAAQAYQRLAESHLPERLFDGLPVGEPARLPGELRCVCDDLDVVEFLVDREDDPEHEYSLWFSPDEVFGRVEPVQAVQIIDDLRRTS